MNPVDSCTLVLYARTTFGTNSAQSRQWSEINKMHKIFTRDLSSLSTCPFPWGWYGIVQGFAASIKPHIPLKTTPSTLAPWSGCKLSKQPNWHMYLSITFFYKCYSWSVPGKAWANLVKWSKTSSSHSWPGLDLGIGPTMSIAALWKGWPNLMLIRGAIGNLLGSLTSAHGLHFLM